MNNEKQPAPICYAIVLKDTKKVLTPKMVKDLYPNYGGSRYWKPSKKFYYNIGTAKGVFVQMPFFLQRICVIQPLGPVGEPLDMGKNSLSHIQNKLAEAMDYHAKYGPSNYSKAKIEEAQKAAAIWDELEALDKSTK